MSEKEVQAECKAIYKAVGCIVYNTSQPRKAKHLTRGIPDLWIFCPARGAGWWHEVKDKAKMRPEQLTFQQYCGECNVGHVAGGVKEAKAHLWKIGVRLAA